MLRINIVEKVLKDIENGIKNGVNADILARKYKISSGHLQRLFKHNCKQTIGEYIRIRKLSASLTDLLKTDCKVVEIALEYGFGYETAYIRSFKKEFGITPGEYRKGQKLSKCS